MLRMYKTKKQTETGAIERTNLTGVRKNRTPFLVLKHKKPPVEQVVVILNIFEKMPKTVIK